VVAAIDQLISMLSIPSVQNLARKGMEFELRKPFIKINAGTLNLNMKRTKRHVIRTIILDYSVIL
jgi:hypothetical protein